MSSPLESIAEYESFVYALPDAFPCIQMSTLVVVHTGPMTAAVKGEVLFGQGLALRVVEIVDTRHRRIGDYGYELWQGNEELNDDMPCALHRAGFNQGSCHNGLSRPCIAGASGLRRGTAQ